MALQDISGGRYKAVLSVPATAKFNPQRDVADSALTGSADLVSLVDGGGNPIGSSANPLYTTGGGSAATPASNAAVTSVPLTTGSSQALASNVARKGAMFTNAAASTAYILYGTGTASSTLYSVALGAGQYFNAPMDFTGAFQAALASGTGNLLVTELS